jgi:hypothetical protein
MNLDPMTLTNYNPNPSATETEPMTNLNDAVRLFILNLPEVVELRKAAATPDNEVSESVARAIQDGAEYVVQNWADSEAPYLIEGALDDYDFGSAIEHAFSYGTVDINSAIDADEVISNSGDFDAVRDTVNDLESKVIELEALVAALTNRLDDAAEGLRG